MKQEKPAILVSFQPQTSISDNFADWVVTGEGWGGEPQRGGEAQ